MNAILTVGPDGSLIIWIAHSEAPDGLRWWDVEASTGWDCFLRRVDWTPLEAGFEPIDWWIEANLGEIHKFEQRK